ncbi:MAG: class I SAM-dependent methyltransferase [Myxococcota bacterium]
MTEWTAETAEWYAARYGEHATNQLAIDALDLTSTAHVLDVGCGTGSALRQASAKVTSGVLIGVDPVPRMVEIAKERLEGHPAASRIAFHVAPAHALPIETSTMDVVLAFDSFDHWGAHQRAGLAEVRRVLAPMGRFVVVKDGDLPYPDAAKQAFLDALTAEGFEIREERKTEGPPVAFTTWILAMAGSSRPAQTPDPSP